MEDLKEPESESNEGLEDLNDCGVLLMFLLRLAIGELRGTSGTDITASLSMTPQRARRGGVYSE